MFIKNLKHIVLFLVALLLASAVRANLDDLNLFHQVDDTQDSLVWPILPDESLADLAAKFYPKNKGMQRKFIRKTKQLNKDNQGILDANTHSTTITAIVIPNLQSLSVNAGVIKRSPKAASSKALKMSYNIQSTAEKAKLTFQNIPARLVQEYEELVAKNTFLKEQIAELNKRLVFLQTKLGQLKLVLDKTLSLPPKKTLKNLDTEKSHVETPQHKPAAVVASKEPVSKTSAFDLSNKFLWFGILALGLLLVLSSYLYKKYQERKYLQLVNGISKQNQVHSFGVESEDTLPQDALLPSTTINKDTVVEEQDADTILREAKMLVAQSSPDEAIEHIKWAIKANSKTAISVWLYLLELFRKQNLKDDFEKFAFQMHQNFNVMTPPWEERQVAMIVPQSLEEFPYIRKLLTDKWPNPKLNNYLQKLVSDNRSGERSGFSKPVIEEILLLIDVLEVRTPD